MKILAFGAHPDDVDMACFGTLARCVQRGDTVIVCSITNGNLGHPTLGLDKLRMVRMVEGSQSSAVIGASYCTLDIDDMNVNEFDEHQRKLVCDLIRSTKPDLIITHNEGDTHPDHLGTNHLVQRCSILATLPQYKSENDPIVDLPPLYYMDTLQGTSFEGDTYVDISDTFELKMKAVGCHTSQLEIREGEQYIDILQSIEIIGSYRGLQCGKRMAELFLQCPTRPKVTSRQLP
jgi:LmbE family N-acetylglucosaminyl deacetylase